MLYMYRYCKCRKSVRRLAAIAAFGLAGTGCFLPAGQVAVQAQELQPSVMVSEYRFSGQSPVPEAELAGLIAGSIGKPATLKDLEREAEAITCYLRAKGYFVASAYIPAQDFSGGKITIVIEPGRYDKIIINNQTTIRDEAIRRELGQVASGAVVEKTALERAVWLIGEPP